MTGRSNDVSCLLQYNDTEKLAIGTYHFNNTDDTKYNVTLCNTHYTLGKIFAYNSTYYYDKNVKRSEYLYKNSHCMITDVVTLLSVFYCCQTNLGRSILFSDSQLISKNFFGAYFCLMDSIENRISIKRFGNSFIVACTKLGTVRKYSNVTKRYEEAFDVEEYLHKKNKTINFDRYFSIR